MLIFLERSSSANATVIARRSNNNNKKNERDPWSDLKFRLFIINLNPAALSGTDARKIYEEPLIVKISV